MSTKIQVKTPEIEKVIHNLKSATNALHTALPSSIGGKNILDVVKKLNLLCKKVQRTKENYKTLLTKNNEATLKSVQYMSDTDRYLSQNMKTRQ